MSETISTEGGRRRGEGRIPPPKGQLPPVRGHASCINASKSGKRSAVTPRRKRRVKSMGRYPFRALLPKYFDAVAPYKAPSTLANEKRILRRVAEIIDPTEPMKLGMCC